MITAQDILSAKILIADDCERNAHSLAEILRLEGYCNVRTTDDSREIEPLEAANRYGLIILDMQVPHITGLEVMHALKKSGLYPFLPVLALSGDASLKHAALDAGARAFLAKPYVWMSAGFCYVRQAALGRTETFRGQKRGQSIAQIRTVRGAKITERAT